MSTTVLANLRASFNGESVGVSPRTNVKFGPGADAHRLACLVAVIAFCLFVTPLRAAELPGETPLTADDYDHWAFRQLVRPALPNVSRTDWPRTPVDYFILAAQERANLQPLPEADRTTLVRRLTFSLTGLPPTPDEIAAFVADARPDAVERWIDRLLATPAYAERAAQHWLDLARFAETDGFEFDSVRPNAWRYRDWVIDAFARDMPYDEFLRRQLAGDLLAPSDPAAAIPTGFLLCGPDMPDQNLQDERRHLVLNEMTATVGSVFLGLQMGCAECHDHKFDPISQGDYYRLRAFFEAVQIFKDHPVSDEQERAVLKVAREKRGVAVQRMEMRIAELEEHGTQRARDKNPDFVPKKPDILAALSEQERTELAKLRTELEKFDKPPPVTLGRVVQEGTPRVAKLFHRGDFRQPLAEVRPEFPRIANERRAAPLADQSPREALAQWLSRPDNPLATRTIANRLWQQHFARPLVATPSDFGLMGETPTHPELLEWLATELPARDWSLKQVHRLLIGSATYRQQSRTRNPASTAAHRLLLVGMNPRRLDGEEIRDAMLAASDQLDRRAGGPGVQPPLPAEITATLLKNQWTVSPREADHHRRSIYLFVRRNLRYPLLEVFDRPDTNASCPQRNRSTIAPQALTLLNSELTHQTAKGIAESVVRDAGRDSVKGVEQCFARLLGRPPTAAEQRLALQLLRDSGGSSEIALRQLVVALINVNEFLYVE